MKTLLLTSILFLSIHFLFAQTENTTQSLNNGYKGNFVWEKVDSVKRTKEQLYSDTKLFIGNLWKSTKDAIQNDDKEGGVILVKGISVKEFIYMGATYVYTYSFNTTFRMKENKYKVIIDNVICTSTIGSSFDNKMMLQPHDDENCPYLNKKFNAKCNEVMLSLKNDMQSIVDNYDKAIKTSSNANDGW